MRYIIKRVFPDGTTRYVYRDFPFIEWNDEEKLALRMHPERAAKASYHLMLIGMSHSIIQKTDIV